MPRVLERDIGVADVAPGLLEVAQDARGVQSLGAGLSVALYDSGFRLARGSTVLADTVTRGAPVTAVMGSLDEVNGHPREQVTSTLMHVRIDAVRRVKDIVALQRGGARRHDEPAAAHRLPADRRPDPDGCRGARRRRGRHPPRLAARDHAASPRPCPSATCASAPTGSTPRVVEQPAFTWVLGTDVSIGPVQVPRAVDLRQDGRIAVHVWAPRAVVTVTDTPRDAVTDSNA